MRLPAIAVALAAVLIFLYLISKIFPRLPLWAPAAACLLNSTFLISSRMGLYADVSIHWLLLSLTLLCLWKWSLTRRPLLAFLAFACVGFGIYSKIIFVWFAFPTALVVAYASRRDGRAVRARLAGLCALGLLLGSLPLLIANAESGWRTAALIRDHLIIPAESDLPSNLSLFQNLATRSEHLLMLLTGSFQFPSGALATFDGMIFLILFGAVFFLFREDKQRAALAAAGAFIAAFFFGSMLTISSRIPLHLHPILPPVLLLGGVALATLIPGRLPLLLACLLLLLPQLEHFNSYLQSNAQATDERSSRALASLSEFLSTEGSARPVVALDLGLGPRLFVASGGKVAAENDFIPDRPHSLKPGSMAICLWEPPAPFKPRLGCGRLLRDSSFVLGEIRKFPAAPDPPVYAAITVLGIR